jgi:hypothetical protein
VSNFEDKDPFFPFCFSHSFSFSRNKNLAPAKKNRMLFFSLWRVVYDLQFR